MKKSDELSDPTSCLNKAKDDDLVFVLIETDEEAPDTIRYWAEERVSKGKNKSTDKKIITALAIAQQMEDNQRTARNAKDRQANRTEVVAAASRCASGLKEPE